MASTTSEDDSSEDNFSDICEYSRFSTTWDESDSDRTSLEEETIVIPTKSVNLALNLAKRQLYGRFTKHPKSNTEKAFNNIHYKCKYLLRSLIRDYEALSHIFMGFTLCGQYFLSYTERLYEESNTLSMYGEASYEYELYIWRFIPGKKLQFSSKHKIFKHLKGENTLEKILFMQFPNDMTKIVCCGFGETHNPDLIHISILTLPTPKSCVHCHGFLTEEYTQRGWCIKHGFVVHYMFATTQPAPKFDPQVSLGFPGHLVINTGHHIHILNVKTVEPASIQPPTFHLPLHLGNFATKEEEIKPNLALTPFSDRFSEISESASEYFGTNSSVVDAILEDFSEYDLDGAEGNKPFHELNISCEPLNVTGKSYHNALVQNIIDPRMKRLQSKDYQFSAPQSSNPSQSKAVDKNNAVKVYEFTEENEKYEKISLFRKKRLADKKYEFSEDNTENIVPFHILRRERRYLYRPSTSRSHRSPEYNALFLSPRSPIQSPSSRNGQFSPIGNVRNIYTSLRMSPHHSKSPMSPRETSATRKFMVYSPSLDAFSDCSDSDSRLIRTFNSSSNNGSSSVTNERGNSGSNQGGLLIVDPKVDTPKWIRKVVRRYSNSDFETSSLLSGQSRDDYNIPVEIPLIVQSLTDQHFDVVPDFKADSINERHIIVSQRSIDCEQFVQRRAQMLCSEAQMDFMHCEDYDIKIHYVCPLQGTILCSALIKIGATRHQDRPNPKNHSKIEMFTSIFLFTWSIATDSFDIIEPCDTKKLVPSGEKVDFPTTEAPKVFGKQVLVLGYDMMQSSKTSLRDNENNYEIVLQAQNARGIYVDDSDDSFFGY